MENCMAIIYYLKMVNVKVVTQKAELDFSSFFFSLNINVRFAHSV